MKVGLPERCGEVKGEGRPTKGEKSEGGLHKRLSQSTKIEWPLTPLLLYLCRLRKKGGWGLVTFTCTSELL